MKRTEERDVRSPAKLLFITAFLIPAANNLIFGWGMLLLAYFSMDHAWMSTPGTVFGVLYQALRAAALGCTFVTLGYYAGKTSFIKALPQVLRALLCAAGAAAVSVGLYALTVAAGWTDASSYTPFSERFFPYVGAAALDLAVLFAIEALFTLFFALSCRLKGRENLCAFKSPLMVTAYVLTGVYTLFTMTGAIKTVLHYDGTGDVFNTCVLPFLTALVYGCVMLFAILFFRGVLRRFFEKDAGGAR